MANSDMFAFCTDLEPKNSGPVDHTDYLRDQLQEARTENDSLKSEFSKISTELAKSQRNVNELLEKLRAIECNEFSSGSKLASEKIIDLSKKLREKTSEVEVYKTRCAKTERKFNELETEPQKTEERTQVQESPEQMKRLEDKLKHITSNWLVEKNNSLQLKNDLKKAKKWLQQEIGEKFETLSMLDHSSTPAWRGRAQIIQELQQKNATLRNKLEESQTGSGRSDLNHTKCREKYNTLDIENTNLQKINQELKKKLEAVKTRCKILQTENELYHRKEGSLLEKHEKMLQRVKVFEARTRDLKTEESSAKEQLIKKVHDENENLRIEVAKQRCLLEKLSKEIEKKDDSLQVLNARIRSGRPPSSYVHRHDTPEVNTIRYDAERLRLLELTEIQNQRLNEERNEHMKTQQVLRSEKQRGAKMEAKVARLELDHPPSVYSKMTPKEENDVVLELELANEHIKALNTRLKLEEMERQNDLHKFSEIIKNLK